MRVCMRVGMRVGITSTIAVTVAVRVREGDYFLTSHSISYTTAVIICDICQLCMPPTLWAVVVPIPLQ